MSNTGIITFCAGIVGIVVLGIFGASSVRGTSSEPMAAQSTAASRAAPLAGAQQAAFRQEVRAYLMDNPEVLMEAIAVLESRDAEAQAANDVELLSVNAAALFESENDWVGGNPDGNFTVVEFLDYRCGYCRRAHAEVETLLESDGDIRLIVKEFPILGEASVRSSQFAIAVKLIAGDEAYKGVHDALIALRQEPTDEVLTRLANTLGLDGAAVVAKMASDEVKAIIAENHALGQRLQINGTPTFVMGDQLVRGYLPLDGMLEVIAQERG